MGNPESKCLKFQGSGSLRCHFFEKYQILPLIIFQFLLLNNLNGEDWPNWLGPNYNGAVRGND